MLRSTFWRPAAAWQRRTPPRRLVLALRRPLAAPTRGCGGLDADRDWRTGARLVDGHVAAGVCATSWELIAAIGRRRRRAGTAAAGALRMSCGWSARSVAFLKFHVRISRRTRRSWRPQARRDSRRGPRLRRRRVNRFDTAFAKACISSCSVIKPLEAFQCPRCWFRSGGRAAKRPATRHVI